VGAGGDQDFAPWQLSYSGGALHANVIGTTADVEIDLMGAPALNIAVDVIA
jgi:stage V sporulation protein SpoVS